MAGSVYLSTKERRGYQNQRSYMGYNANFDTAAPRVTHGVQLLVVFLRLSLLIGFDYLPKRLLSFFGCCYHQLPWTFEPHFHRTVNDILSTVPGIPPNSCAIQCIQSEWKGRFPTTLKNEIGHSLNFDKPTDTLYLTVLPEIMAILPRLLAKQATMEDDWKKWILNHRIFPASTQYNDSAIHNILCTETDPHMYTNLDWGYSRILIAGPPQVFSKKYLVPIGPC